MKKPQNCALIIFGASGNLTKRKLVPGLFNLNKRDLLPEGFGVLGVGRTVMDDSVFRAKMADSLKKSLKNDTTSTKDINAFVDRRLYYQAIDIKNAEDYSLIKEKLKILDREKKRKKTISSTWLRPPACSNLSL